MNVPKLAVIGLGTYACFRRPEHAALMLGAILATWFLFALVTRGADVGNEERGVLLIMGWLGVCLAVGDMYESVQYTWLWMTLVDVVGAIYMWGFVTLFAICLCLTIGFTLYDWTKKMGRKKA